MRQQGAFWVCLSVLFAGGWAKGVSAFRVPAALVVAACLFGIAAAPALAAPQILPTASSTATQVYASSSARTNESGSYTAPTGKNRILVLTTSTYRSSVGTYNLAHVSTTTLPTWNGITFTKSDGTLLTIGTTNGLSAEQFYAPIGDSDVSQTSTLSVIYETNVDRKQAAITCLANVDQNNPLSDTHYGANANSGTTTSTAAATGYLLNGPIPADYVVVDICAATTSGTLTPNASPIPVQTNVLSVLSFSNRRYSTGIAYISASDDKSMAYTISAASRWNLCATAYKSSYSVSATAETGGSLLGWTDGDYDYDTTVDLMAEPDPGYVFTRWEANVAALGAADNWQEVSADPWYSFQAGLKNDDQGTPLDRSGHALRAVFTEEVTTPPVITLNGAAEDTAECGSYYEDPGATAVDGLGNDITWNIVVGGDFTDTSAPGTYTITYDADDGNGHYAEQVTRVVTVADTAKPFIDLIIGNYAECGSPWSEDYAVGAWDDCAGDVTANMIVGGDTVDTSVPGGDRKSTRLNSSH